MIKGEESSQEWKFLTNINIYVLLPSSHTMKPVKFLQKVKIPGLMLKLRKFDKNKVKGGISYR